MSKPREFWLNNKKIFDNAEDGAYMQNALLHKTIHVIEYHALTDLQKRFDDLRVNRASCCVDMEEENESLQKENVELKENVRFYKNEWESACNRDEYTQEMLTELIELRAQLTTNQKE